MLLQPIYMIKNFESLLDTNNIQIQSFTAEWTKNKNIELQILRLDLIHHIVSGNKWFKLKYYLADALRNSQPHIVTVGGAHSNHIVATAFACQALNIPCTGLIRGEEPLSISHTLVTAKKLGMHLQFISRTDFKNPEKILQNYSNAYFIPMGGFGKNGAKGASEILTHIPDAEIFSHIVCAVGTGTMMAGIINAAPKKTKVVGISVLKNNFSVMTETESLISQADINSKQYVIENGFHFNGYAKYTDALIKFMNTVFTENNLPTDFVYTAKVLYGIKHLALENYFPEGSKILMIHSGGLQGNLSLSASKLIYM